MMTTTEMVETRENPTLSCASFLHCAPALRTQTREATPRLRARVVPFYGSSSKNKNNSPRVTTDEALGCLASSTLPSSGFIVVGAIGTYSTPSHPSLRLSNFWWCSELDVGVYP
jgi:hypothetical protein